MSENAQRGYVIDSDTFTPTGKRLGYGCWGVVDEYEDPGSQKWAIKGFCPDEIARRQMAERNWTEEDVMRNESIPLSAAAHHLVPRIIERDKKGRMFIAMPVYESSLLEQRNLGLEEKLGIFGDVVNAATYMRDLNRAHGDIKPANILIERGRGFLTDLGSSTCISISNQGGDPRDNIGDESYRAFECYKEGSRPTYGSDVFSLGALFYEMLSGKGIKENDNDLHLMGGKEVDNIVRKRIRKNIPRPFRKLLRSCLYFDESKRLYSAGLVKGRLEEVVCKLEDKRFFRRYGKLSLAISAPAVVLGALIYGAATYEPKELRLPRPQIHGPLKFIDNAKERVEFDFESLELPKAMHAPSMVDMGDNQIKRATNNFNAACLLKAHMRARNHIGGIFAPPFNTEAQQKMWLGYTSREARGVFGSGGIPHHVAVVAKSIEVGLDKARTLEGKVDLEDALSIARLGVDVVNQARRASGSFDFKDYIGAKNPKGEFIISEKEQKLLKYWLAYSHDLFW